MPDDARVTPWAGSLSPDLGAEALAALAAERPDLWPEVARHPNAYPDLRRWIAEQQAAMPQHADPTASAGSATSGSRSTLMIVLAWALVLVLVLASIGVALAMNKVWPFEGESGFTADAVDRVDGVSAE